MMDYSARAWNLLQEEPICQIFGTVPQPLAAAEFEWHNREMHLVDEISFEKLAHRFNAAPDAHVFAIGRFERLCERVLG